MIFLWVIRWDVAKGRDGVVSCEKNYLFKVSLNLFLNFFTSKNLIFFKGKNHFSLYLNFSFNFSQFSLIIKFSSPLNLISQHIFRIYSFNL